MKKPISAKKTPQEPELCLLYHSWLTLALSCWLKPSGFGRCLRTEMQDADVITSLWHSKG